MATVIRGKTKSAARIRRHSRLRKKIGQDRIETVRGLGYRLSPLAGESDAGGTNTPPASASRNCAGPLWCGG